MTTIYMSERRPVEVDERWEIIAIGTNKNWDGQYEFQANRIWSTCVEVRENREVDGYLVYGKYEYFSNFQNDSSCEVYAGHLITNREDLPRALNWVTHDLIDQGADDDLVRRAAKNCLHDLPAEQI